MADMGIYSLWPVFTTLDLGVPTSAEAWATHTCAIVDYVSRPVKNDFAYPAGCAIRLKFAERGDQPAVDLFWYDGGMKPRLPEEVEAHDIELTREGVLFVGDEGSILAGFHGQNPQLFARGKREPLDTSGALPEDQQRNYERRHRLWLDACLGSGQSAGSFPNASAITDAVNLGTVALRAGRNVLFDSDNMRITNASEANQYLVRQYRPGWEL